MSRPARTASLRAPRIARGSQGARCARARVRCVAALAMRHLGGGLGRSSVQAGSPMSAQNTEDECRAGDEVAIGFVGGLNNEILDEHLHSPHPHQRRPCWAHTLVRCWKSQRGAPVRSKSTLRCGAQAGRQFRHGRTMGDLDSILMPASAEGRDQGVPIGTPISVPLHPAPCGGECLGELRGRRGDTNETPALLQTSPVDFALPVPATLCLSARERIQQEDLRHALIWASMPRKIFSTTPTREGSDPRCPVLVSTTRLPTLGGALIQSQRRATSGRIADERCSSQRLSEHEDGSSSSQRRCPCD